jgi:hypothetical protein
MLLLLELAFAIALPVATGYALLSVILKEKSDMFPIERTAYAFGLGSGLLTLEMFIFPRFGVRFSVINIALPNLLLIAVLGGLALKRKNTIADIPGLVGSIRAIPSKIFKEGSKYEKGIKIFLLAWIALKLSYVFFEALIKPVVAWDAFTHWSFSPKIFFLERTIPDNFKNMAHANAHINNQLAPLFQTWIFTCIGDWNEIIGKIIFPLFFTALLIAFYYALRRNLSVSKSLLFSFFLISMPFLVFHATIEYADLLVAFYLFSGTFMVFEFFEKHKRRYLAAAALLLTFSAFTKNEGLFYSLSTVIALAVFLASDTRVAEKFNRRTLLIAAAAGSALFFGYILREVFFVGHEAGFWHGIFLDRLPVIISVALTKMFLSGNWNILWILFTLSIFFFIIKKEKRTDIYILLTVALNVFFLAGYYLTAIGEVFDWVRNGTILSRNMLLFTPLVLFFAARQIDFRLEMRPEPDRKAKRKK